MFTPHKMIWQKRPILLMSDPICVLFFLFFFWPAWPSQSSCSVPLCVWLKSLSVKQRRLLLCCTAGLSRRCKATPWQKLQSAQLIKKRSWWKRKRKKKHNRTKNAALCSQLHIVFKPKIGGPSLSTALHGRLSLLLRPPPVYQFATSVFSIVKDLSTNIYIKKKF